MKLIVIFCTCCLIQGISSEAAGDLLRSVGSVTKGLFNVVPELLGSRTLRPALSGNSIKLDTIRSLLQQVSVNVDNVDGSVIDSSLLGPLSILSSLSTSVNSAFESISKTCHLVGSEVGGFVGSVDIALSGVNLALLHLIDSIVVSTSATVAELSYTIDDSLDTIIQTVSDLVSCVEAIFRTIDGTTSLVKSTLQGILKTTVIVLLKAVRTVSNSLEKLNLFVTVNLSTVIKTLSKHIGDEDVTVPVDVSAIVRDLQKCSQGAVVDVEIVSSTLDGSCNDVDYVVTAISTCPPDDEAWTSNFDDLSSSACWSIDEIIYVIKSVTKATPELNLIMNPVVVTVSCAVKELINAAQSASNGNGDNVEPAIVNIAVVVQNILNALNSVTTVANAQPDAFVSYVLESIQLSVQSLISIVYDVFCPMSPFIEISIDATSILPALTTVLEIAIDTSPSTLVELIPKISDIVNCN